MSGYGWIRDAPDERDRLYHEHHPVLDAGHLPTRVDLSPHCPPIWNQGQLGSCTGHGIARVLAYEALRQGETLPGLSADNAGYSRLFIYYGERELEGTVDQDCGAQIRDGIKVVAADGCPFEEHWPYSDANPGPWSERPPGEIYAEAADHKAIVYHRVTVGVPGAPMRSALAAGRPIVFGFRVPSYFEDGSWDASTDPLPLPTAGTQYVGGHCVVVSGYDFSCTRFRTPAFQVDNSWGESWGMGGRFWMDSRWFTPALGLTNDLWTISRVE